MLESLSVCSKDELEDTATSGADITTSNHATFTSWVIVISAGRSEVAAYLGLPELNKCPLLNHVASIIHKNSTFYNLPKTSEMTLATALKSPKKMTDRSLRERQWTIRNH